MNVTTVLGNVQYTQMSPSYVRYVWINICITYRTNI